MEKIESHRGGFLKVSELTAKHSYRTGTLGHGARKWLMQLTCFGCGLVSSGGSVFGAYAPFGISFSAAVPFSGIMSSLIGSAIGYLLFPGENRFRYLAAILAVIAIRWTLSDIGKLNRHALYAAAVCFVPTLATGLATMTVSGFDMGRALMYGIEALLGGVAAYFFSRTIVILNGTKSVGMLLPQEIACLVMSTCIGLLSLSALTIGPVSVGRIAAVLCMLLAARYGGITGGAIAGTACGIVLSLASFDFTFLGAAYAFSGLMAGLFSPTGRLASALIFLAGSAIVSLQSGSLSIVITILYEGIAAAAVFLLLPRRSTNFLSAVFTSGKKDEHCQGLRDSIIMRLDFASKALSDVSGDVEEVAEKLSRIVTPTLENVYQEAVNATCQKCGLRVFCWEHRDGVTLESFDFVNEKLQKNGSIKSEDFREDFRRKCCRSTEMAMAVNRYYKNFLASEAASKRVDEIRSVVAGQFCGLGDILREMADEYESYEFFDTELSGKIVIKLKEMGLVPTDVSCRVDHLGRMTVEAAVCDIDRRKIRRAALVHEISKICGRRFDSPAVTAAFGQCRIVLCERPSYDVEIASSQHICGSGRLCGDNLRYFPDGMGRMIAVLSDGMGTGGRAAVDSGMAVSITEKLLKAGLGFDCTLKVVNSALLVKSEDESLSTLDIVSLDCYTGLVDFMKAGAALSLIRKRGEIYRVETPSLPIGILSDVEFTYTEDNLTPDDIIIMLSDGALSSGDEWIERILLKWQDKSMQDLAHLINDEAVARRTDGHDDDITVIALRLRQANVP